MEDVLRRAEKTRTGGYIAVFSAALIYYDYLLTFKNEGTLLSAFHNCIKLRLYDNHSTPACSPLSLTVSNHLTAVTLQVSMMRSGPISIPKVSINN